MTEKEKIKIYKNVLEGKDDKGYSQWEQLQKAEIAKLFDNILHDKIKNCEVKIFKKKKLSTDESAGGIVNNMVVILTVYISIFSSLYIAMVGGVMSVKTELSKLTEDPARISDFEIFSNELFSGLYSLILRSAGLLIIFTVVGMLLLEAFQRSMSVS